MIRQIYQNRKWGSVAEAPAARAFDFQGRWCRL